MREPLFTNCKWPLRKLALTFPSPMQEIAAENSLHVIEVPRIMTDLERRLTRLEFIVRDARQNVRKLQNAREGWAYVELIPGQVLWIEDDQAYLSTSDDWVPPREHGETFSTCCLCIPVGPPRQPAKVRIRERRSPDLQEPTREVNAEEETRDSMLDVRANLDSLFQEAEELEQYEKSVLGQQPERLLWYEARSMLSNVMKGHVIEYGEGEVRLWQKDGPAATPKAPRRRMRLPPGRLDIFVLHSAGDRIRIMQPLGYKYLI